MKESDEEKVKEMLETVMRPYNNDSWWSQYLRMLRWYKRAIQFKNLSEEDIKNLKAEDYWWAFFVSCWHLKDWLVEDKSTSIKKNEFKQFCITDPILSTISDITDTQKHMKLSITERNTAPVQSVIILGNKNNDEFKKIPIQTYKTKQGEYVDAHELALAGIVRWIEIISERNIANKKELIKYALRVGGVSPKPLLRI